MHPIRLKPITLVALTGLAGTGKDTVADTLVHHHGFIKLAFADALRQEVAEAFAITTKYLTQRETKEHPISALALDKCLDPGFMKCMASMFANAGLSPDLMSAPRSARQIMQWWGTEYRRAQKPDYWTIQADNAIFVQQRAGHTRFVISDCRFDNEAAMVRTLGGSIWQVVRPSVVPTRGSHASETEGHQFLPDALLGNTHSVDHLRLQALTACNRLQLAEVA